MPPLPANLPPLLRGEAGPHALEVGVTYGVGVAIGTHWTAPGSPRASGVLRVRLESSATGPTPRSSPATVQVGCNGATQPRAKCCRDVAPLQSGRLYFNEDRSANIATEGRLRLTKRVRRSRSSRRSNGLQLGVSWTGSKWRYSPANRSMWRWRAVAGGGVDAHRSVRIAGI